jgi:pentatricopeptide repeat protein
MTTMMIARRFRIRCRHLQEIRRGQSRALSIHTPGSEAAGLASPRSASLHRNGVSPNTEETLARAQTQPQPQKPSTSSLRKRAGAAHRQRPDTEEQRRGAEHSFDFMLRFVEQISEVPASAGFRQAFVYWMSRPTRNLAVKRGKPDLPLQCARRILDNVLERGDSNLIQHVLYDMASPNTGMIRMMISYMTPFQGTRAAVEQAGRRVNRYASGSEMLEALVNASQIQQMMDQLHEDPAYPALKPDIDCYEAVLNLWGRRCMFFARTATSDRNMDDQSTRFALGGKTSARECIDEMKRLIETMEADDNLPNPNDVLYSILLTAFSHSRDPGTADEANAILQRIEQDPAMNDSIVILYNNVILAYANQSATDAKAAGMAIELWERMKARGDSKISTNPITYSILMNMFAKLGNAEETQRLLDEMEATAPATRSYPTRVHYNIALNAWAKTTASNAGDKAESLLLRMHALKDSTDRPAITPDKISYTAAMDTLLRSPSADAIERAEALLDHSEQTNDEKTMADTFTYNCFLRGLSICQSRELEAQAKEAISVKMDSVLVRMRRRSEKFRVVDEPHRYFYNICLHAWANSHSPLAGERAYALFQDMETRYRAGNVAARPDTESYMLVLKSLGFKSDMNTINIARELLQKMDKDGIRMTVGVLNQFLRVLAKSDAKGAVQEAERILQQTEDSVRVGTGNVRPNEASYHVVIEGYSRQGGAKDADRLLNQMKRLSTQPGRIDVRPNVVAYAAVMDAWGKSEEPDALDRVESLFEEMCRIGRPNSYVFGTYQSVLHRSRLPDAPKRVEAVLNHMQQEYEQGRNPSGKPNAINFSLAINSWAGSELEGAPDRAEAILDRIEELHRHSNKYKHLKPTVGCYKGVIQAWALSGRPDAGDRAVALLDRMENAQRVDRNAILPNGVCYRYVMVAIGRSDDAHKASKVRAVLERMKAAFKQGNRYALPGDDHYAAVLRACTTVSGSSCEEEKAEAYQVACAALSDYLLVESAAAPNETITLLYLQACNGLLPTATGDESSAQAEIVSTMRKFPASIFQSTAVRNALLKVVSRSAYEQLLLEANQSDVHTDAALSFPGELI